MTTSKSFGNNFELIVAFTVGCLRKFEVFKALFLPLRKKSFISRILVKRTNKVEIVVNLTFETVFFESVCMYYPK